MLDPLLFVLCLASVGVGIALFLFPRALSDLNALLNRTLATWDTFLMRYRYLMGLSAFIAGYAFFKLALLLPVLRG